MDRYVKKKKIGEGSFGKALLVQSKTDGKEYVIKEISISKMKKKEREESKKEVAVLKQMKHPNIVSYQESFEEVGNLYIVMDYCDGGDLYKAINSQRGILFTEDKVLDWFVQICLALKHVHDRKILHRDLKSQNIFLTRKGIIKLGDFGIARVLNSTMELARTCIGTPYYLSPEICENRPYNNKSDVWALGCVLYELCTLKHAFEAGNMKNLVLKIIRGSYPPVSPRYSYELRNLIALLFKRNPRDRPSINTILKKPLIQKRIQSFLTETQVSVEFSHTILHRKRPGAPSVGGGRPVMAPPVRKPVQPVRISNPSAKYGVSVAAKKPPSAGAKRVPGNKIMNNKDFEKKKQELIAKERERRNQNIQVRVRQQKLADKQRMDRMNRAREVGWKSTLSSGEGSSEQEKLPSGEPPRKEPKMDDNGGERPFIELKPAKQERGKYDHYHDYLDNLKQGAKVEPAFGGIAYKRQAEDNAWPNNQQISEQIRNRPVSASAAEAARRAAENRAFAANAANRGKEAQEFWERKRQAAMNKARGNAQMMGWAEPAAVPKQKENQPANQLNAFRNKDEQDYLERLKAIRVQNYNERRQVQKQAFGGEAVKASIGDPRVDADARRKKIEALKAQADERAAKLKEELARKRQEAFQKEKQHRDEHVRKMAEGGPVVRAVPAQPQPIKGPVAKVLGITDALKQIHSDKGVEVQEQERPSAIEKEKENQKVPEKRKQWGAGDRKALPLNNMPLEITASGMEATGVADAVVKHDQHTEHSSVAAGRKHWAGHGETVLNALQARQLALETTTFASPQPGSQMGVTVIKGAAKTPVPKSPIQPGTITISKEVKKTTDNTSEESIETIIVTESKGEKEPGKSKAAWSDGIKEDKSDQQTEDASSKDIDVAGNEEKRTLQADSIKKTNTPRSVRPSWERKLNQSADAEENKTSTDSLNISGGQKSPRSPIPPWQRKSVEVKPTDNKEGTDSQVSQSVDGKSSKGLRSQVPPWQRKSLPNAEDDQTEGDGLKRSPEVCVGVDSKSPRRQSDKGSEHTPARKSLISQVDLADDEDVIEGGDSSPAEVLGGSKLLTGLQTGHFDTDVRILRTCSEPDLCKLFRTTLAMNPFLEIDDGQPGEDVHPEDDVQLEDVDDEAEGDGDDENDEMDEDELYQSMLENMESVLTHMDENKEDEANDQLENEVEEPLKEKTKKEGEETPPKLVAAATDDNEDDDDDGSTTSGQAINEDWDSGDGEDEDYLEKDDDLFCRLEESRVELEKELGCDTFLQVYKSIQAIHEDEDENIEEGKQIANKLLGKDKTHLYPKIFQLVMADSAFTENNE